MATGARTGGEPSGAHWDHRAEARDTAGGPGRYTNTGHGEFVGVDKQKVVALVQSRPSSNVDANELPAPVVGTCKSHSSNIVDVLSGLLDKAQSDFDDTCHAESNDAHNFSMLQLLDVTPLSTPPFSRRRDRRSRRTLTASQVFSSKTLKGSVR